MLPTPRKKSNQPTQSPQSALNHIEHQLSTFTHILLNSIDTIDHIYIYIRYELTTKQKSIYKNNTCHARIVLTSACRKHLVVVSEGSGSSALLRSASEPKNLRRWTNKDGRRSHGITVFQDRLAAFP